MKKGHSNHAIWKDTQKRYLDFLSIFPEVNNKKVRSTFNMMALWDFQSELLAQKRFIELVWIHPNLTELIINSMITTHFFIEKRGGHKVHVDLVDSLNLQQKARLLLSLGIIDQETYSKLEMWRALRNSLVHKLMQKVRSGMDLDKECEHFCKLGIELQERLHDLLMDKVRKAVL